MKFGRRKLYLISAMVLLAVAFANGQVVSKIDGVFYGDYNYIVKNHDPAQENLNDFSIRRIYFTFENNLTETIKTRFRLESAHEKFGTSTKINPFVKHAYLEWSNLIPNHKLVLGIAETNAFKNSEELWAYRSIEKTIMDLNKICPSADMGIALKGDISNSVHHWLTVMNGPGYGSSEVDKFKKIGYAFWVTPMRGLILEGYADYDKQHPNDTKLKIAKDYTGSKGYTTLKGFLGYNAPRYSIGVEMFQLTNQGSGLSHVHVDGDVILSSRKSDVRKTGFSVFGSLITPVPRVKLFGRYDRYDPNADDDVVTAFSNGNRVNGTDDEVSLIIAGLDYIPVGNLHLMPNILVQSYAGSGKDSDMTVRMTLYYKFDSGKIIVE